MSHSHRDPCDQYQVCELNVSHCVDEAAFCVEVNLLSQPDLSVRITLVGAVDIIPDLAAITNRCRENFCSLELIDHTRLLGSAFVREMAQENTVHGIVLKRLLERSSATTDDHQLCIYEQTLRELLARFAVLQGDYS